MHAVSTVAWHAQGSSAKVKLTTKDSKKARRAASRSQLSALNEKYGANANGPKQLFSFWLAHQ